MVGETVEISLTDSRAEKRRKHTISLLFLPAGSRRKFTPFLVETEQILNN